MLIIMSHKIIKYVVVIPARNEENYIGNTLKALFSQSVNAERIIVVNDGSTDGTAKVLGSFNVDVVELEDRGYNAVKENILAETFNAGFKKAIELVPDYSHILVVGADTILPNDYMEIMLNYMDLNDLSLSSGIISGEENIKNVRGSGRIITRKLWREFGEKYIINEGWESYILYWAGWQGYNSVINKDMLIDTQRPTSSNYKWDKFISKGKFYRMMGYTYIYTVGGILKTIFVHKNIKPALYIIRGYITCKSKFEKGLRKHTRKKQWQRIRIKLRLSKGVAQ